MKPTSAVDLVVDGTRPVFVRLRQETHLQAWQVTAANVGQVATWCGGRVMDEESRRPVVMFDNEREDDGYTIGMVEPGEWLLRDGRAFHVLDSAAFEQMYEITDEPERPTGRQRFDLTTRTWRNA